MGETRNLLIVDDVDRIGEQLAAIVDRRRLGYRAFCVSRREDFLVVIDNFRIDTALIDLRMPDANGLDLLTELKTKHPFARVYVMSAHATPQDRLRGLQLGAAGFIEKPFETETLLEMLR